jgi:hypothetical protein
VQTWHYILRKPPTARNDINALQTQGRVYCSSRVNLGRTWADALLALKAEQACESALAFLL